MTLDLSAVDSAEACANPGGPRSEQQNDGPSHREQSHCFRGGRKSQKGLASFAVEYNMSNASLKNLYVHQAGAGVGSIIRQTQERMGRTMAGLFGNMIGPIGGG